jgi:hypothetical protein
MNTYQKVEKCKTCTKIDTKVGRVRKEQDRIHRWNKEQLQHVSQRPASIEAAERSIGTLEYEIPQLEYARQLAQCTL